MFEWLKQGQKTIDVRKGNPHRGEFAVFLSGSNSLRLRIVKKESGRLMDIVRSDNYWLVIPSAKVVGEPLFICVNFMAFMMVFILLIMLPP